MVPLVTWGITCLLGLVVQIGLIRGYIRSKPPVQTGLNDRLTLDQSLIYLLNGIVGVPIYITVGLVEEGYFVTPHQLALVFSSTLEVMGVCLALYVTVGISIKFLQVRLLSVNLFEDLASEDTILYVVRSLVICLATSYCLAKVHILGPNNFYFDMVPGSLEENNSNPIIGSSIYIAAFSAVLVITGIFHYLVRRESKLVSEKRNGGFNFLRLVSGTLVMLAILIGIVVVRTNLKQQNRHVVRNAVVGVFSLAIPFVTIQRHAKLRQYSKKRFLEFGLPMDCFCKKGENSVAPT